MPDGITRHHGPTPPRVWTVVIDRTPLRAEVPAIGMGLEVQADPVTAAVSTRCGAVFPCPIASTNTETSE